MTNTLVRQRVKLPGHVLALFWEYPKRQLSWAHDAELIICKILESGEWESVKWLLATTGYAKLKSWIVRRQGAGLDPKRLRFWQATLNLPQESVNSWIASNNSNPWQQRWHR
jgi:hypothetical protein